MGSPGIANIRRVLKLADDVDIDEGRIAYVRYNQVCRELGEFYGFPFESVVKCFAALSPNSDYISNLRSTATLLCHKRAGVEYERITTASYGACRARAWSYLDNPSLWEEVKGPKILSFYRNITQPLDSHAVTIDGHAVNIWRGRAVNLKTVAHERWKYEAVAQDYRKVALKIGLLPNQLQAITWFTWKRINEIKHPGRQWEMYLDVSRDFWRTLHSPEDIKVYSPRPANAQPVAAPPPPLHNNLLFTL